MSDISLDDFRDDLTASAQVLTAFLRLKFEGALLALWFLSWRTFSGLRVNNAKLLRRMDLRDPEWRALAPKTLDLITRALDEWQAIVDKAMAVPVGPLHRMLRERCLEVPFHGFREDLEDLYALFASSVGDNGRLMTADELLRSMHA